MSDNKNMREISIEELDEVTGGTSYEVADDSRFLNSLNGSTDRYGAAKCCYNSPIRAEIRNAWKKLGIRNTTSNTVWKDNKYFLNGKQITQEQARQHAMEITGHYMTEEEWKW